MGWNRDAWRVVERVGDLVDALAVGLAVLAASALLAVAGLVAAGPGQPPLLDLTSPHSAARSSAAVPATGGAPAATGSATTVAPGTGAR